MKPILSVQRTAVMEGENVLLRCEVPEEKPPFHFIFYKTAQLANGVVHERSRKSQHENFVELEFPIDAGDNILYFECAVKMDPMTGRQISERSNRTIVTVSGKLVRLLLSKLIIKVMLFYFVSKMLQTEL